MSDNSDLKKNLPSSHGDGLSSQHNPPDISPLTPTDLSCHPTDPELRSEPAALNYDISAHKFELEPEPPSITLRPPDHIPAYEHLGELPHSYATGKLYLTPRDPHWLFCYWDLSFDQLMDAERSAHDGKVFLQIYLSNGERIQQIHINPWSRDWMIHTNRPNTGFYAEIGFYRYDGSFEVISRSGSIVSPRDTFSDNTEVRFATIPFTLTFRELLEIVGSLAREGEGLAETLSRLQEEGYPLPFDHHKGNKLTPEERESLLSGIGQDILKRTWIDSQEIVERFSQRFQLHISDTSGQWPPSSHWLSGSSLSSPFTGRRQRGFSMHVNAELIIYGGTEPDASLKIDGRPVPLDPNGNFHFHFNFNDGKFHIPIEATSADGQELRSALLSFLRLTATSGGVDSTEQPLRDQPMGRLD
ncbi:MAG: DUF4912 domain-containing protein [Candidatus Methylacidiphilales bacterium]